MSRAYPVHVHELWRDELSVRRAIALEWAQIVEELYVETHLLFHLADRRLIRVLIELHMAADAQPDLVFLMQAQEDLRGLRILPKKEFNRNTI